MTTLRVGAENGGSLMGISNIDVPVDVSRFSPVWLAKQFPGHRPALRVALAPVDRCRERMALQPTVKRIRHPGAEPALKDTTTVGARLEIAL